LTAGHVGESAQHSLATLVLSERLDIEAVVRDPADYFAARMDVVNDSRFTHDEMHRTLESWALDAQLRSQAEAENMPGKDRPRLQEVRLALQELQKQK
jgi:hypothetical protein